MKLLTAELLSEFNKQGDTSNLPSDKIKVLAKFFSPVGGATWFAVQYYPEERNFFGYATLGDPDCAELGYFNLDELEQTVLPLDLSIERDLNWDTNITLQEVINKKGML